MIFIKNNLTQPRSINKNVMLLFYLQPILLGNLLVRIPDIKENANLNKAELATSLIGLPIGSLILLFLATYLVRKLGVKFVLAVGFPCFMLSSTVIGLASTQIQLFIIAMCVGAAMAFTEVGLNLYAAYAERANKKMIMNRAHGCWSLGEMSGGLIGSLLIWLNLSVFASMTLCMVLTLPISLFLIYFVSNHVASDDDEPATKNKPAASFSVVLICIGIYLFCIAMIEGAGAEWSALYLTEILSLDTSLAGLGFSLFAAAIAANRLLGDYFTEKIGAVLLARILCIFALIGLGLIVFPINAIFSFIGFALLGVGISLGFPLSMSAAGKLSKDPSFNISFLSVMAIFSFMAGPPVIGFISEVWDLRYGFGILIPLVLIALVCTFALRQKHQVIN